MHSDDSFINRFIFYSVKMEKRWWLRLRCTTTQIPSFSSHAQQKHEHRCLGIRLSMTKRMWCCRHECRNKWLYNAMLDRNTGNCGWNFTIVPANQPYCSHRPRTSCPVTQAEIFHSCLVACWHCKRIVSIPRVYESFHWIRSISDDGNTAFLDRS